MCDLVSQGEISPEVNTWMEAVLSYQRNKMEYNNEKLTKLVGDKIVEKIVFNTWNECRIIRKDKSVKYMS